MSGSHTAGELNALPDERLAMMSTEGVEGAFDALYRRHRERLLGLCRAMLGHPHDAEEATQAAMLSAYRALARGHRPRAVGAWLASIARNECLDLLGGRRVTVPLSGEVADTTAGPPEQAERRERIAELRRDLADLPRGQRTALVLRGLGGMPHAEIARVVGGTESDARHLVSDARATLGEFEEGRALECAQVQERIDAGDGRALRARRIRAHLRVCDDCRAAVGTRRGGLAALLPGSLAVFLRGLAGGGNAGAPIVGGAAIASLAAVGALVLPAPWTADPGQGPERAAAASAAALVTPLQATSAPAGALTPAGGDTVAARAAGPRQVPPPGAAPSTAPVSAPTAPAPPSSSAPAPVAPAAPGSPSGAGAATGPATTPAAVSVRVPRVVTPAVTVPPVTVPSVTVPSVTVPSVTVPSVTVPSVTVPSVPLPGVTVPSVTLPPVSTPRVTVPPVATPAVTTPPVAVEVPSAVTTPQIGPVPPVTVELPLGGGSPITLP